MFLNFFTKCSKKLFGIGYYVCFKISAKQGDDVQYWNISLLFLLTTLAGIELSPQEQNYLAQSKNTITMCVDPDWEPFEKINEKNKHEGIAADIIQLLASRLGVTIRLIPTKSWQESLEYSKAGKCDIMSFLNETPQRKEWLFFTEPIFSDPNVLVGRSELEYIEDISKENLSIALPQGTAMAEFFARDFPNLTIIPTVTESQAFRLVEEKKADLTLRSLIVAAYTIKKEGLFNLKIVGELSGYENYLRIGVIQEKPLIKTILNKGIATLTKKDIDSIVNTHVTITIEKVTHLTIAVWIFALLVAVIGIIALWNSTLNKRVTQELAKNAAQQKQLIKQEQKAKIGELLGNISHQWKNGLTQIGSLNIELLLRYHMKQDMNDPQVVARLQDMENSISFLAETINTFLDYYKEKENCIDFKIAKSIQEVLTLIDIEIKYTHLHISVVENYPMHIEANKNEWYHIWLNLFVNSMDQIKAKNLRIGNAIITIERDQIVYRDDCGGIPEGVLSQIQRGEHIGLGLKMIGEILKKSNFGLEIDSKDGSVIVTMRRVLE